MKALLQTCSSGRVLAPPEKRFLISLLAAKDVAEKDKLGVLLELNAHYRSAATDAAMKKRIAERIAALGPIADGPSFRETVGYLYSLRLLWAMTPGDPEKPHAWCDAYYNSVRAQAKNSTKSHLEICEAGSPGAKEDVDAECALFELVQGEAWADIYSHYRVGIEKGVQKATEEYVAKNLGELHTNELMTAWGAKVTPENAWREYPRPEMIRGDWASLNGNWELEILPAGKKHVILVPFPVESQLSGVREKVKPSDELVYKRKFVFAKKSGYRNLLHFESVDFRAQVLVNGVEAGIPHEGNNAPFSYDVTALVKDGENEIEVRVWDPTDDFLASTGKQTLELHSCFFPASSGICGSVWTECVPETYLERYEADPDVDGGKVIVRPIVKGYLSGAKVTVEAFWQGKSVAQVTTRRPEDEAVLALPKPLKLWSPKSPALYDLEITVEADGHKDVTRGYFGMRKVGYKRDAKGISRVTLNDEFVFFLGPLDQGWWPDGYLTPPSEDACRWDVDYLKAIGMNTIRKHIKVEPRAFYAHCDKVGLMVMQDMPSAWKDYVQSDLNRSNQRYGFHRREMDEIVKHLRMHPAIVCWIPYNEGWGQPDEPKTLETGRWFKRTDKTRLVNLTSGWRRYEDGYYFLDKLDEKLVRPYDKMVTDILDEHRYPGPLIPKPNPGRPVICGEFGGVGSAIDGHCTSPMPRYYKYLPVDDQAWRKRCRDGYRGFTDKVIDIAREGASGSIYTEDIDQFWEYGGFVTFDRAVERLERSFLRACHEEILSAAAAAAASTK